MAEGVYLVTDVLERIAIEPREGGRCFEEGPEGFQCDWGRVLEWKPPNRLVFSWQIGPGRAPEPDPNRASEVEVRFLKKARGTTRVELEHRGFARHGEGSGSYRAGLAADEGWAFLLERYSSGLQ